jgi:hypothetical protein
MPGRRSGAMERALAEVKQGVPPYRAARNNGLSPSAVYVAIAKDRKKAKIGVKSGSSRS